MDVEKLQENRKSQHLKGFMELDFHGDNGFGEYELKPLLFPEAALTDIHTETDFLGKCFAFPLMINAITGGFSEGDEINRVLYKLALEFKLPMAVGSQSIALKYPHRAEGFKALRKYSELGFLIANISALSTPDEAKLAVEMLNADAIQLHVNCLQELAMTEGDRDFRGMLSNIEAIVESLKKPVILKGVGVGMDYKNALTAFNTDVAAIDVGGLGGTDFAKLENWRKKRVDGFLEGWGITTYESTWNVLKARKEYIEECILEEGLWQSPRRYIVASGGMERALDGVKAIDMGADMIGVAGAILRAVITGGESGGRAWIEKYMEDFKKIMLLIGKKEVGNGAKVSEC